MEAPSVKFGEDDTSSTSYLRHVDVPESPKMQSDDESSEDEAFQPLAASTPYPDQQDRTPFVLKQKIEVSTLFDPDKPSTSSASDLYNNSCVITIVSKSGNDNPVLTSKLSASNPTQQFLTSERGGDNLQDDECDAEDEANISEEEGRVRKKKKGDVC